MFKVRWFSPKGGMLQLADATTKEVAIADGRRHTEKYGGRYIVLQKMRGGWRVVYDTELGY